MNIGIVLIIIVAVTVLICIVASTSSKEEAPTVPESTLDHNEIEIPTPQHPSRRFRIAGLHNYCGIRDIGPISGELRNEPDNKHDKQAVMVIEANKEKLLGYIPKDEKAEYRKISQNLDRRPFVGYIETFISEEGETRLFAVIRTYQGPEDEIMTDLQNDWKFLHAAFRIKSKEIRMQVLDQFKYY